MHKELNTVWAKLGCDPLKYFDFPAREEMTSAQSRHPFLNAIIARHAEEDHQQSIAEVAVASQNIDAAQSENPSVIINLFTHDLQKAG